MKRVLAALALGGILVLWPLGWIMVAAWERGLPPFDSEAKEKS